jgi:hypothetical protein
VAPISWSYKLDFSFAALTDSRPGLRARRDIPHYSPEAPEDLNLKYQIDYKRLHSALVTKTVLEIALDLTQDRIHTEYVKPKKTSLPVELHFEEGILRNEKDDNEDEVTGCLWFISLLSRVDGLVLMKPNLEVRAFGVEITTTDQPHSVVSVSDPEDFSNTNLKPLDYNSRGTRHRSVMRYCWTVPDSLGLVLSQDGGLIVVSRELDKLLVWDNVSLHLHELTGSQS